MRKSLWLLLGALALLAPTALADVIPISDVNADDGDGFPVLWDELVTVKGVVTVPTGLLSSQNDIYVQDATGGVNVIQDLTASPIVALGDSLLVTGKVSVANGKRTFLYVNPSGAPGSRIRVVSSGNAVPAPVELTPREVMTNGEAYEGTYAVLRGVSLPFPSQWPTSVSTLDKATTIADADTSCWLWFDVDTDIDGSPRPLATFDAYGVVIPDLRPAPQDGYGILPPSRADVRSIGAGSGFCTASPARVYAGHEADLSFAFAGEGEVLTRVSVEIPAGWTFSGIPGDVMLAGDAFAVATVVADSTNANVVTVAGAALVYGTPGTVTLLGVTPPSSAGSGTFPARTANAGGTLAPIQLSPSVSVGTLADPGTVLLNEIYAYGADSQDRSEFIELVNPGDESVSLSGWILTDIDESGLCGGVNLWEFPASASIAPHDHLIVAKDAKRSSSQGFQPVFGFYPDFELLDSTHGDVNYAGTPDLTLVSALNGNAAVGQEIRLLGGPDGNGAAVVNVPSYEAVYLYSDRTLASLVDALEYRDPVFWSADGCGSQPGLGGDDDAWVPGPPPQGYSLGRDEFSTDTDTSREDLFLCSQPTPGDTNAPVDSAAPSVLDVASIADVFLKVTMSEPVSEDGATDLSSYSIAGGVTVLDAWLSRDERTVLLRTDAQTPDAPYELTVSGVSDLAGNEVAQGTLPFLGYFDTLTPISAIQAWDNEGGSLLWGATVATVGFATVPPGVFQPDRTNMYIQDLEEYGINVYSSNLMDAPALEGDLIKASGQVMEYRSIDYNNPFAPPPGSTTEISDASISVIARGFDIVQPAVLSCGDVNDERNEGRFIQTSGVVTSVEGFAFFISDNTGVAQIYQNFTSLDFSRYAVGDSVRVTGVLLQYDYDPPYFEGYELAPRYQTDLVECQTYYAREATISATARVLNADADEKVEISINAPRASTIEVKVFDLKGRPIATLASALCVGRSRLTWDAKDDHGTVVPPGTYICSIQAKERAGGEVTQAAVPVVVGMKLN